MKYETQRRQAVQAFSIVAAALYGVVLTTGVLTLLFILIAATRGMTAVDLYAQTFPRFRGAGEAQIPPIGYAIFVLYIMISSGIAIFSRRRFARKWSARID
jgi:hypothetical protein